MMRKKETLGRGEVGYMVWYEMDLDIKMNGDEVLGAGWICSSGYIHFWHVEPVGYSRTQAPYLTHPQIQVMRQSYPLLLLHH